LKIAILGTKGIPNQYGGFEQFAEYLSIGLAQRGHDLTVYAPHFHSYQEKLLAGVKIKHVYCPEKSIGGAAHFIYDYLCLRDAAGENFDIIYEAGYASCALFIRFFKGKRFTHRIITNMDGMEWKRSKWNSWVQYITKKSEQIAVRQSDYLVADNLGIKQYIQDTYKTDSVYLPYGADTVDHYDAAIPERYSLKAGEYFLVIARLEPENNVETVIKAYHASKQNIPLVIIGGLGTKHAKELVKYSAVNPNIIFLGGVYDITALNSLRHFCKAYLHGHSVGGTNPSLLEAMACESFIIAHGNEFNRDVLQGNALFFMDEQQLLSEFLSLDATLAEHKAKFTANNLDQIRTKYDWNKVVDLHEVFFKSIVERRG